MRGSAPLYSKRCQLCYINTTLYPACFYGDGDGCNEEMKEKWNRSCSVSDCIACLEEEKRRIRLLEEIENDRKKKEKKLAKERRRFERLRMIQSGSWAPNNQFAMLEDVVE